MSSAAADQHLQLLRFWQDACQAKAEIYLHLMDMVDVQGKLVEVSGDLSQLLIEQLSTSIGVYKQAIIRTDDLVFADINLNEIPNE